MDLPPDFNDLLAAFAHARVEFVIVGAYAVAFHARPRATKDIDIVVSAEGDNLARVAQALTTFGAPREVVDAVRTMRDDDVVYLGQPPLRIDVLRSIEGVDAASLFEHAIATDWNGISVNVISLDDLIKNKRAVARPQDLIDAELLERVRARAAKAP